MGATGSVAGRGGESVGNGSGEVDPAHENKGMEDAVSENLLRSPWELSESILPLASQTPVTPLLQPDDVYIQSPQYVQNPPEQPNIYIEQGVPTILMWSHGGTSIAVAGSWDNWKTKVPLQPSGKDFAILKVILPGSYHYKFLVDGEWRHAPDSPWTCDEMGNVLNILEVQDFYVPDKFQNTEDLEAPESPDDNYNCGLDFSEDYKKLPPPVPPHLMGQQPLLENSIHVSTFAKPSRVLLNHLCFQKPETCQHVLAVGETCRFRSKYVTAVLYKLHQQP